MKTLRKFLFGLAAFATMLSVALGYWTVWIPANRPELRAEMGATILITLGVAAFALLIATMPID